MNELLVLSGVVLVVVGVGMVSVPAGLALAGLVLVLAGVGGMRGVSK